jgi:hypothetical protein
MSQISPPIRILLVGALAFFAAWMLFLRPGGAEVTPVAEPVVPAAAAGGQSAQTFPGQAVEAGNNAAATADARAEALAGGVTSTGTASATASGVQSPQPTTAPKVDRKALAESGLPMPVLRAIADRKVLVLLFTNAKAADDAAVSHQLDRLVTNHPGIAKRVYVHEAPIAKIARYQQITRGVNVQQSPTLVVVDRKLRADALVGYVDHLSIDQAIRDATR